MADRYWVGGTASWDGTALLKWSTTSGGVGGAAEPTSADNVFIDANSGAVTVTVSTSTRACANFNSTGFTGTFAGATQIQCSGSWTWGAGVNRTYTGSVSFLATTSQTITSNGIVWGGAITFNGIGGTWTCQDDLLSNGAASLLAGTFSQNNYAVRFTSALLSGSTNTRVWAQGTGTLTLTATSGTVWSANPATNFTHTSSAGGRIVLNGGTASTKTFACNAQTYPDFEFSGSGSGICSLTGGATFRDLLVTNTGGGQFQHGSNFSCRDFLFAPGYTGTYLNNGQITISGNFLAVSTQALNFAGGTQTIFTGADTGNSSFTTAGLSISGTGNIQVAATSNSVTFADGVIFTGGSFSLVSGSLSSTVADIQVASFASNNSTTRSIDLGARALTLSGTSGNIWNTATITGLTYTHTGTVTLNGTGASTKTITAGGLTFPCPVILRGAGTGAFIINGSNIFAQGLSVLDAPHTVTLTSGTTQTLSGGLTAVGTAGNLITFNASTPGTPATLSKPANDVQCDYLSVTDVVATGGARWFAGRHSTNGGGNGGWRFADRYRSRPRAA